MAPMSAKIAAHRKVANAIRRGDLTVQPCEWCGTAQRIVAHHDDYDRPLDVWWLCEKHHKAIHAGKPIDSQKPSMTINKGGMRDRFSPSERSALGYALTMADRIAGSRYALAKQIGVSHQAAYRWSYVPAQQVLKIEAATGVSRHDLRPDIYPREKASA